MILHFGNILIGHQPDQQTPVVDHRQFFNFVIEQHRLGIVQFSAMRRYETVTRCHHLGDTARHIGLEAEITVRNDTHQSPLVIDNRNTADFVFVHQLERIAHGMLLRNGHGIVNHAILGSFHTPHVRRLSFDRHILVDDTDTALTRERDSHRRFGHGVHRSGHDRDIEFDITRKTGLDIDLSRQHFRIGGYEQHIIEGETFGLYPLIDERHNERGFCCPQK